MRSNIISMSQIRTMLLVCAVLAVSAQASWADQAAEAAASQSGKMLSLTAENINKVSDAFMKLLSDPYDLSERMLPNDASLDRAGINTEAVAAAESLRAKLRQSLDEVVDIAVNRSSEFVQAAQSELSKNGGRSELLQRLSAIPIKFDAQGNTMVPSPLIAIGTYLVNAMQQQLKVAKQEAGQDLAEQLGQGMAGRKLLQEMEAFEEAVGDDVIDLTQPSPSQGPLAVAKQMGHMMSFLTSLTDTADELIAQYDLAEEADSSQADDTMDDTDPDGTALRKLNQLPDPNSGYAKAVRIIFSNIFDFFRGNGLYGLTPLLADTRGILTRYGWINDLFNIMDAPLENFINANYIPLPQNNTDFINLVRSFAERYCELEKASNSETVLGEFEGPTVSYEVEPVSCPIYTDPDTGRNYVSFEDCEPAKLTIKVTPLTITEAYFSAAEYKGTECKYVEPYGTDFELAVGGGEQSFAFTSSARGIDIKPTVIELGSRAFIRSFPTPDAEPDSDLPDNPAVGNGFFANNWGWSFNGVNPPNVGK